MRRVLVVDDENIRLVLKTLLKRHGYDVEVANSGESALALVDSFGPDVIPHGRAHAEDGRPRPARHAQRRSRTRPPVIVMSAYGSVDLALEAMKARAYDYVGKPFKPDEIVLVRERRRRSSAARTARSADQESQFESILAKSHAMSEIFPHHHEDRRLRTTVLIQGESGVGKEARRARGCISARPAESSLRCPSAAARSRRTSSRAGSSVTSAGAFTDAHLRPPRPLRGGGRRHALPRQGSAGSR